MKKITVLAAFFITACGPAQYQISPASCYKIVTTNDVQFMEEIACTCPAVPAPTTAPNPTPEPTPEPTPTPVPCDDESSDDDQK